MQHTGGRHSIHWGYGRMRTVWLRGSEALATSILHCLLVLDQIVVWEMAMWLRSHFDTWLFHVTVLGRIAFTLQYIKSAQQGRYVLFTFTAMRDGVLWALRQRQFQKSSGIKWYPTFNESSLTEYLSSISRWCCEERFGMVHRKWHNATETRAWGNDSYSTTWQRCFLRAEKQYVYGNCRHFNLCHFRLKECLESCACNLGRLASVFVTLLVSPTPCSLRRSRGIGLHLMTVIIRVKLSSDLSWLQLSLFQFLLPYNF